MASALEDRDDACSEETRVEEVDPAPPITAVYARKTRPAAEQSASLLRQNIRELRVSFVPARRPSWNRSLNTRGRSSIVVTAGVELVTSVCGQREPGKNKPPRPPGNKRLGKQEPPDFSKEISYFQEVDAFELLEESPSPKHLSTWTSGSNSCYVHDFSSILRRWRISKLFDSYRPSGMLFDTIEMPTIESSSSGVSGWAGFSRNSSTRNICHSNTTLRLVGEDSVDSTERSIIGSLEGLHINDEDCACPEGFDGNAIKDNDAAKRKESDSFQKASLSGEYKNAFMQLLEICRQSEPLELSEVFSHICDLGIVKVGEGTFGEAFRAGDNICKIVPIDGDLLVNGEVQKRSEEVLEEVLLSLTLNSLREQDDDAHRLNSCDCFIETRDCHICRGVYDVALIKAWEDWDLEHGSENDNPKDFSENQCYIVFVLADGGKDLESFVLLNYEEAKSLLVQVAVSLSVAEAACEFEHRDLHWGNILLSRKDAPYLDFCIEGRKIRVKANGIIISIIDFTLSRINCGESILFFDLSSDPGLFEGPKGDKQSETYRKMKVVTDESWEESFPKTNILWLQYLVDILLLKKSFKRTKNDERDLRSFRKRLNSYNSAKDSLVDSFFLDAFEEAACTSPG